MFKHEKIGSYISSIDEGSVFVEIGSDRGENSTVYLADLATTHGTRLLTVDIDSNLRFCDWSVIPQNKKTTSSFINDLWKNFYADIRDSTWPEEVESIEDLPSDLQRECIEIHKWSEAKQDLIVSLDTNKKEHVSLYDNITHPSIDWYCSIGSDWCRDYGKSIGKPISLLYLDNFDYNWNILDTPDYIKIQIEQYRKNYNIELNNRNCQIEHFKQMMYLMPFLTQNSVIALDDTYLYNDCWIGKSGPVVVYLLCHGFEIIHHDRYFVILGRNALTN